MSDYHHDLLFGCFLTPAAGQPAQVVALARLAEEVGLDLVSVQDHPYRGDFLDTWTLLSYLAAATSRIRLAGNVLNLPLRQPVVLARSVASLDQLTDGRVELGLGAGAFWDAIEAIGGRRLRPGEAVDALDEAIRIIREAWAADRRGGIRVEGRHYRVVGAKRGPAPAHDIGIWVGGYKPRMLRLIGRAADGWIPSMPYLSGGPADLADMNRVIDEAAVAAGRQPTAIRRLLNIVGQFSDTSSGLLVGPPDQWAEELTEIALEYGVSGFILMSDNPSAIKRFAEEVAPAVREHVAAARARPRREPASTEVIEAGSTEAPQAAASRGEAPHTAQAPRAVTRPGTPNTSGLGVTPTPAPEVRLTDRQLWDESTRPVAPPPPPGHVYSARARAVGQHLIDVHNHLRRELARLRDLLEQVKKGTLSAAQARGALHEMTMRQHNWSLGAYCAAYCSLVTQHHTIEDGAVFPHLRRADSGLAPVLDRLEEEHVVIHELVLGVDRALVNLIRQPGDFSELQEAIDLLTDALLSHLSYEEQQLVEPLARYGFYPGQV